jgi:hypothetical protein
MNRSRLTLAKTLAAAIRKLLASPCTMAVEGHGRPFTGSPSTSACSTATRSPSTARLMARCVAAKMLSLSISLAEHQPVENAMPGVCVKTP